MISASSAVIIICSVLSHPSGWAKRCFGFAHGLCIHTKPVCELQPALRITHTFSISRGQAMPYLRAQPGPDSLVITINAPWSWLIAVTATALSIVVAAWWLSCRCCCCCSRRPSRAESRPPARHPAQSGGPAANPPASISDSRCDTDSAGTDNNQDDATHEATSASQCSSKARSGLVIGASKHQQHGRAQSSAQEWPTQAFQVEGRDSVHLFKKCTGLNSTVADRINSTELCKTCARKLKSLA